MFSPGELPELYKIIRERTLADKKLLDDNIEDIKRIKESVRSIKKRSSTAISLVASDGGNNRLEFDPFYIQLVRVVDSNGKQFCLEAVSPTTDIEQLGRNQFHEDGSPKTALGRLMQDLEVKDQSLYDLSYMIPEPQKARKYPEQIHTSWVQVYRDLCEWAVLYDRICHKTFATNTLIVRDGLLRSKIFRDDYFVELCRLIQQAINKIYQEDRINVYLVGLSKYSKVLTRYNLAATIEQLFPSGDAYYGYVPRDIEAKAYVWPEYYKGMEDEIQKGEISRFVAGDMYFVRFGNRTGDPIWSVDILSSQREKSAEIFGYLQADAADGFPVPFYPRCLQRAHEYAEIVDFDLQLLQSSVIDAIREFLPEDRKCSLEELALKTDVAARRYA